MDEDEILFMPLFLRMIWRNFEQYFHEIIPDTSSIPESEQLSSEPLSPLHVRTSSKGSFDANAVLHFISSLSVSVYATGKLGTINELEAADPDPSSVKELVLKTLPSGRIKFLQTRFCVAGPSLTE